ncbi:MAG: 3'-5' exonuclease, partial [Pseudomonadota bacterium]|nr:3'-5' exonuclease [Pseudomonadota bacterium]
MHGIRPRQKVTQADWKGYMAARAERAKDDTLIRFFDTPIPDPETPLSEVPLVALDMETTGLDERRHAIVSIG